jgi:hypothetical protein
MDQSAGIPLQLSASRRDAHAALKKQFSRSHRVSSPFSSVGPVRLHIIFAPSDAEHRNLSATQN